MQVENPGRMIYNIARGTELLRIKIEMGKLKLEALIDSGASRSLIREDIYKRINVSSPIKPLRSLRLFDVQQNELSTMGVVNLVFSHNGNIFIHKFIITNAIREEAIVAHTTTLIIVH